MNNVKIQDKFSFLKENEKHKNINISDDKITFTYYSFGRTIFGVLFILYGGPIFVYLVYLSLEKHNIIPAISIEHNTLSIILTIIAILFIIILSSTNYNNYKRIIDFSKKAIYTEDNILIFKTMVYDYVEFENLQKVGNNVEYQVEKPHPRNHSKYDADGYKVNSKTMYYHTYYVSFVINNGDFWNYFEIGTFYADYQLSLKFAKALSETLNLPLFKCKDNACVKLDYSENVIKPILYEEIIEPYKRNKLTEPAEEEKID